MKLAIFFLSCFIAVSQQQHEFLSQYQVPQQYQQYVSLPGFGYHGLRQWNNIYSGASSPYSFFQSPYSFPQQYQPFVPRQQRPNVVLVQAFDAPANDEIVDENQDASFVDANNQENIEARVAGLSSLKESKPESRAAGLLLPALLFGTGIYGTSTKYTFVTTTITSTSIQSCILSGSFSPGSTTACRRRREVMLMEELLGENNIVVPSQVQSVEPSSVLSLDSLGHSAPVRAVREAVNIDSSKDEGQDQDLLVSNEDQFNRANRAFALYSGLLAAKTTSTITTATVSVTAIKKTITLNAGASLLCLPSGFSVC